MNFDYPAFLYLLPPIGLVLLIGCVQHAARRRRLVRLFGGPVAATRLAGAELTRFPRALLLPVTAALLALLAAAGPRREEISPRVRGAPGDVMIGIDISRSMQASDAAPSRVEAARRVALALIEGLGEQRVGVFLFAGQPYVLVPPTEDADLARWFIEGVDRELVNENDEGTRIHAALEQSAGILTANRRETGSRSVVLISDGETSEDVRQLVQVARDLASRGIIVHTIGVGTEGGAGVSVPDRPGRWGGPIIDPDGRPAITRLNEPLLREVADAGGGIYLRAGTAASVDVTSVSPLIRVVASGRVGGLAGLDPATGLAVIALGLLVAHPLGSVLRHRSASRLRGKGARG